MGHVKEILDRVPPPILYHYTDQHGLLGILKSKEIWASHTQYLNDAREFRHAVGLVKKEVEGMLKDATGLRRDLLLEMQEAVKTSIETINVCVCSFSEERDILSQWRALRRRVRRVLYRISGRVLEGRKRPRKLLAGAMPI